MDNSSAAEPACVEAGAITEIAFTLNGAAARAQIAPRQHMVDVLRQVFGLTGTHLGCEHGVCGACHILVDGHVVRGCLMLAIQANGAEVVTIEGLNASGAIADLQEAFVRRNALQCGFCTPGMLMTAHALLQRDCAPQRAHIRETISGNICRCTGYHAIVDAIEATARERREARDAK
ncbi:MAG TPA: (2Fe-2S)-binding protein [Xanthobacteraceae bacterium]|jgi:carbon-monoxide dehydrogenase small subunit|nr:(2Fe-2S)-binding protein [Xanthobacteraceae bacterium]